MTDISQRNKEILIAKIETLQDAISDDVIRKVCDILLDFVKATNGIEIGFKTKVDQ